MRRRSLDLIPYVSQCIDSQENIDDLKNFINRLERCCKAVELGHNIADVMSTSDNLAKMLALFGDNYFSTGMQAIARLAMRDFSSHSVVLDLGLPSQFRIASLRRALAGWSQFHYVLCFTVPALAGQPNDFLMMNPSNDGHWNPLNQLPPQTLATLYIKSTTNPRSLKAEQDALHYFHEVLTKIQRLSEEAIKRQFEEQKREKKRAMPQEGEVESRLRLRHSLQNSEPIYTHEVLVNKLDIFIHAGNASIIIRHLRKYDGTVKLAIIREKKKYLSLDPDSIWAAEVRNGETVFYEFYGKNAPDDDFIKELILCTNKYTQMDKTS